MSDEVDVDQGWAWVVMMAAFASQVIGGTLLYGAGIVHVALLEEFGENIAFTSLAGALFSSLMGIAGPIVSLVVNTYSCRVATMIGGILCFSGFTCSYFVGNMNLLLITYGIIAGMGLAFCVLPAIIVMGYSFKKYLGIVVGFNVAGAGVGMLVSGPFVQFLIDSYGLRGTFLILAAVAANVTVCGVLMRPSSQEKKFKTKNRKPRNIEENNGNSTDTICFGMHKDIFKNKSFLLILVSSVLWNVPYSMVLLHLPYYSVLQGSTTKNAASLMTTMGLGSIVNRILTGLSLGPRGIDPLLMFFGIQGIAGLLTLTFPLYSASYSGQVIYSLLYGMYSGGLNALLNPLAVELVGVKQLSTAAGLLYLSGGIGFIIGPPIAGLIVDNGGTYEQSFYCSGLTFLMACLVTLSSSFWKKDNQRKNATKIINLRETGSGYLSASLDLVSQNPNDERSDIDIVTEKEGASTQCKRLLNPNTSSDSADVI